MLGHARQRSLEEAGDRLVVFMNENEQFRVNHRFCKPFVGTSQDDIMRRVSRGNKRMAKAIKVRAQLVTACWASIPFQNLRPRLEDKVLGSVGFFVAAVKGLKLRARKCGFAWLSQLRPLEADRADGKRGVPELRRIKRAIRYAHSMVILLLLHALPL